MQRTKVAAGLMALLACAVVAPTFAATQAELEERIIKLEKRVQQGDAVTKKRIRSLKNSIEDAGSRMRVSGYMSAGVAYSEEEAVTGDGESEFENEFTYRTDSKAGIQFDYRLSPEWTATLQLTTAGKNDWSVDTDYAYLKWQAQDWLAIRAGRLRLPFFMYSESISVGFTYPWARPPLGFYITSIANFEGADALITFETGDFVHLLQPYFGTGDGTLPNGLRTSARDGMGIVYEISKGNLTGRLQALQIDSTLTASGDLGAIPENVVTGILEGWGAERIHYYTAGLRYDNGDLLVLSELSRIDSEGTPGRDIEAGYITIGYTLGQFQPYATYMKTQTVKESQQDPIAAGISPPYQAKGAGVGVRYNITSNVSLKTQFDHYFDFDDTQGIFSSRDPDFRTLDADGTNIYSVTLDAVF
jgi:hypothetical protein